MWRGSVLAVVVVACSSPAKPPPAAPVAAPVVEPAAPVVAAPAEAPKPPALRLPGDVAPASYALELTIDPKAPRATGIVRIAAKVVKPTTIVWLNATDLVIDHASIDGRSVQVVDGKPDFIGLVPPAALHEGDIAIEIAFSAAIDHEKSRGIYAANEGADAYVYTFFEAIDARRAFPCFDEPIYKVPWTLTFHVAQDHVALGNAPVVRETPEPNGMKKVELAASKPLPSYLVAFVVGPFEVIDDGRAGRAATPIRFIIPKGRSDELRYAKQITPKVVTALEDYFAMPYPYGKLDVAVVPRYWGTMEHPGIVAMGQPLTLIRPDAETRDNKMKYTNILAHELSHYWFGDYVTMAWWDDTWLNEALGEWSDMNITDAAEPSWQIRDNRVWLSLSAMTADETLASHPIRQSVDSKQGIQASFDNDLTYAKGSAVLRMFEAYAGRDRWRDFINGYLHAHAWGNASAEQFFAAMTAALGDKAAGFRTFIDQPGVPLVTMTCNAGKLALHQRRALPAGVTDPEPRTWTFPVCVRDDKGTHCALLDHADGTLDLGRPTCPAWLIPNADANGYYRSAVDPKALAHANRAEKMLMLADLRAMVERGEIEVDRVLALVPELARDRDPKVAHWALLIAAVRTQGLDDTLHAKVRAWVVRTIGPVARGLGWQRPAGDSDDRQELRAGALQAVGAFDDTLAAQGSKLAETWLAKHSGIADDLVDPALSAAAYRGDRARFDRFVAAAKSARDRSEQQRILTSLGRFRDPALAQAALDLVLGKDFDVRETTGIFYTVLGSRETRDLALAWLGTHIDELLSRMRDDDGAWLLGHIAGSFCDADRRAKVVAIVEPRAGKVEGAKVSVTRGLEKGDQCIAETARELPALQRFFK